VILGLDMATKTGWCFVDDRGQVVESGVQDFTKKRGEGNGLLFLRFRKWLNELTRCLVRGKKVRLIAYEQAHHRGGAATVLCVGLETRAQEQAAKLGIESAPVMANRLKHFATGKGRARKGEMIEAAARILGRAPVDDNEADAVHVARWAYKEFYEEEEW